MYEIDEKDEVLELKEVPQSSVGAPIPVVLAGERNVILGYYLEEYNEDWNGTWVREVNIDSNKETVAVVSFNHCSANYFGPPNDESFNGHPLYKRGLGPYGSFEILESSWIRKLERMNSVHPYHNKERFMKDKRHFVFSFHDSIFECVAIDFEISLFQGSIRDTIPYMIEKLK